MSKYFQDSFIATVSQLELQQLRYFVSVAENLNFSRAAEELYVTQPLLSQQISSLEKIMNVKLFERNRKKIELTAYGTFFLKKAKEILIKEEQIKENLLKVAKESEKIEFLNIACDDLVERSVLTGKLFRLSEEFPDLDVNVRKMRFPDFVQALKMNQVQIGFTFCSEASQLQGLNSKVIMEDEYVILIRKPKRVIWDFQDLLKYINKKTVLVPNRDARMLGITKDFLQQFKITAQPLFYNNVEDLFISIETDFGFTIIPKRKYRYYINSNVISYGLGTYEGGMLRYAICWNGEIDDMHAKRLIDLYEN